MCVCVCVCGVVVCEWVGGCVCGCVGFTSATSSW